MRVGIQTLDVIHVFDLIHLCVLVKFDYHGYCFSDKIRFMIA